MSLNVLCNSLLTEITKETTSIPEVERTLNRISDSIGPNDTISKLLPFYLFALAGSINNISNELYTALKEHTLAFDDIISTFNSGSQDNDSMFEYEIDE
jgi:hypothetical protein